MKIEQTTLQKTFTVKYKGKSYYVDYLNSDGQILGLINRYNWEINDEEHELLDVYGFKNQSKKERSKINKNIEIEKKLIKFCIKHFDDYNPIKIEGKIKAETKRAG